MINVYFLVIDIYFEVKNQNQRFPTEIRAIIRNLYLNKLKFMEGVKIMKKKTKKAKTWEKPVVRARLAVVAC